MNRKILLLSVVALSSFSTLAMAGRGGFGGGRGGSFGGSRGGSFGGYRGAGSFGGYRGGGFEGSRGSYGSYGGRSSYAGRSSYGGSGSGSNSRLFDTGPYGGSSAMGARSGSYTTARGGTVDYGAAGRVATGPGGMTAGRGAYGVSGTTAGGRSYGDMGRVGGVEGPGGASAVGRSNVGMVSGANGAIAGGSRSFTGSAGYGDFASRSYGGYGTAGGWGWHNPAYAGYNSGWVHGYWGGGYGGWGGAGYGLGLAGWGLGSSLYNNGWGYLSYINPYYSQPVVVDATQAAGYYDYSQPIDSSSAAPQESVAQNAVTTFDQAREAFKSGDYAAALSFTDQAIKITPNNADLHQFRAIALIALSRYEDAAAALYGVLSVGPGWDWTTLIGFYPDVETFTQQQRALEAYVKSHPQSAAGAFVLASIYLTENEDEAAIAKLKQVTSLQPGDRVSAQLLQALAKKASPGEAPAAPPASSAPGSLAGNWTATPGGETSITLKIAGDGKFSWTVTQKGQSHALDGQSTYADGVLTLVQNEGGAPMVGRVSTSGGNGFVFQALGGGTSDPGLIFKPAS